MKSNDFSWIFMDLHNATGSCVNSLLTHTIQYPDASYEKLCDLKSSPFEMGSDWCKVPHTHSFADDASGKLDRKAAHT